MANNIIAANVEPMTIPAISPPVRPSSSSEPCPTVAVGVILDAVVVTVGVGITVVISQK